MKNALYLLVLIGLFLSSCNSFVKEVSLKNLPENKESLVLNAYISPQDTILAARILYSNVVFGETQVNERIQEKIIDNAKVFINEGSNIIELKFDNKQNLYLANTKIFKIKSGKTYQIKVTDSNGQIYSAETTVPQQVEFKVLTPKKINQNEFNYNNWEVPINLEAQPNTYYRIGVFSRETNLFVDQNGKQVLGIIETGSDAMQFFKNESQKIQTLNEKIKTFFQLENNTNSNSRKTKMVVFNVDQNYFKYHESIKKNFQNENPFAEPSLTYSNVNNGYGCFGSYASSEKPFEIK
jgi:Domain of unknown function (DUF4249)